MTALSAAKRLRWVDYAKGIGIFLVVLGHGLRGLVSSSILSASPLTQAIDQWIYAFHMPLFFLLSGLFVERSLSKPFQQFLKDKLRVIAYPYFVWSLLQSFLQIVVGNSTNNRMAVSDLWKIFYSPILQFWFLYVLFVLLLAYALLRRFKVPVLAILVAGLLFYYIPVNLGSWGVAYMIRLNAPYFLIGAYIGSRPLPDFTRIPLPRLALTAAIGFLLVSLAVVTQLVTQLAMVPLVAIAGVSATIAISVLLDRLNWLQVLVWWGTLSLEIYVSSTIFQAVVRILLQKVGILNPALHLVVSLVAAIYLPILLVELSRRLRVPYLFSLRAKTA